MVIKVIMKVAFVGVQGRRYKRSFVGADNMFPDPGVGYTPVLTLKIHHVVILRVYVPCVYSLPIKVYLQRF